MSNTKKSISQLKKSLKSLTKEIAMYKKAGLYNQTMNDLQVNMIQSINDLQQLTA